MKKSKLLLLLYFRNAKRAWVSSDGVRYPKRGKLCNFSY
jgi:hypothetical protein